MPQTKNICLTYEYGECGCGYKYQGKDVPDGSIPDGKIPLAYKLHRKICPIAKGGREMMINKEPEYYKDTIKIEKPTTKDIKKCEKSTAFFNTSTVNMTPKKPLTTK